VRPSEDFLRPLCQIWVASLSYLWQIYVRKRPEIDINFVKKNLKLGKKEFLRPAIQYLNEIWPVDKKVWPPLLYVMLKKYQFKYTIAKAVNRTLMKLTTTFKHGEIEINVVKMLLKIWNGQKKLYRLLLS